MRQARPSIDALPASSPKPKREGWQTINRNDTDVKVRSGSQTQAYIARDETLVFLTSETLTAEQLATVAAGLKPAPTASSV